MRQRPPHSLLTNLPRALLLSITFVILALATFGQPVSWAAPVMAPPNQTVPPPETMTYLPRVSRQEFNLIEALSEDGRFDTLVQALEAANLTTALESAGPFTIFAPTDTAFDALPVGVLEQLLANPTGQLTQILLYHVVPGAVEIDDLEPDMQIITQQGKPLTVQKEDGETLINGATILTPTLTASNGLIHPIEVVLLPPPD